MPSFDFGHLHPALIHYPIAFIFIVLAFDIAYWFTKKQIFQSIATYILAVIAIIIIPVALTGFMAKSFYIPEDPDVLRHQYMAITTVIYTIGYAIFRVSTTFYHKFLPFYLCLILTIINIALISVTAEFGSIVIRGKGIMFESLRPNGYSLPYNHVEKP